MIYVLEDKRMGNISNECIAIELHTKPKKAITIIGSLMKYIESAYLKTSDNPKFTCIIKALSTSLWRFFGAEDIKNNISNLPIKFPSDIKSKRDIFVNGELNEGYAIDLSLVSDAVTIEEMHEILPEGEIRDALDEIIRIGKAA